MPAWNNFIQTAKRGMPDLVIGEVEREHLDKVGDSNVSSFPTIKFYKKEMASSGSPAILNAMKPSKNNAMMSNQPQQNTFKNVLQNIMKSMQQPENNQVQNQAENNVVLFEDNRTTDKLIKFARDNLVKDMGAKMNKTKRQVARKVAKAIKTKRVLKPKKEELTNALAKLSVGKKGESSNAMTLPKYKKAKKTDAKVANKVKKEVFG
jgi:hypothetical protein